MPSACRAAKTLPAPSGPSNFEALLHAALAKYSKRTGTVLVDHVVTAALEDCSSPDAILAIFEKQAQAFDQFRKGDPKLIKWLGPVVKGLCVLCTSAAVETTACVVFPPAKAVLSGIGVLLCTAKYVKESYDALADIFECIENFLRRLKIYTEIPPTPAMTETLVKIMIELLSVLALATKQINQGRFKRYAKKLLGERDIEAVLSRLDRLTMEESRTTAAQTLDVVYGLVNNMEAVMEDGKASTDDIRQALVLMQEMTTTINKIERDKLQRRFRRWLAAPDPWTNHNIARKAHHRGTAAWFTHGDIFKTWKEMGSLLWIYGKPGSGKSVLCSEIIEDVLNTCQTGLATIAFFYFDFRDAAKQDARSLLSSILIQLSNESDHFTEILSTLYSTHGDGFRQPSIEALTQCLKSMLRHPGQGSLYVIIDAVDESPNTSGLVPPRSEVLGIIQDLVDLDLPLFHYCVTSRPEVDIREALEPMSQHVSLHDQVGQNQDIVNYVNSVVNSHPKMRRWREEDKKLVIGTLTQRADGMFRWIYCQLETLARCFPPSIRQVLNNLPETLDETYERTLQGIDREKWDYAYRLFQCLVISIRPLRVDELAEVLAVRPTAETIPRFNTDWRPENAKDAVLSACSTLIAVVNVDDEEVVQFSHFSVREYLTSNRVATSERVSHFHVLLRPAHTFLARASLSVLLQLDDSINKGNIWNFPLASYAAKHWVDHAQFEDVSSLIQDGMESLFDEDKPHFAAWIWVHDLDKHSLRSQMSSARPERPEAAPLYYAALCGFHDLAERLVNARAQNVNDRGGQCVTPLHAAASKGHVKVAQLLLKKGAYVNARDDEDGTPLHRASLHGDPCVVRTLLHGGADPNVENENDETPLYLASRKGRLDAARLLLEHGADANHQDSWGWSALRTAAANGQEDVAELLLRHGAEPNSRDADQNTPLHMASLNGRVGAVRVLLDYGSHVDARDRRGGTPLQDAAQEGFLEVVRVLLGRGADANAQKEDRWAALHVAAGNGHLEVVEVLLGYGGDPLVPNGEGETPLQVALRENHPHVAQFLSERSGEVMKGILT